MLVLLVEFFYEKKEMGLLIFLDCYLCKNELFKFYEE